MIARRLAIVRNAWGYDGSHEHRSEADFTWAFEKPGRFAKYNLKCGCVMCKKPRYARAKDGRWEEDE